MGRYCRKRQEKVRRKIHEVSGGKERNGKHIEKNSDSEI